MRCGEVALDTFTSVVVYELSEGELPTIVGMQHLQHVAALLLCLRLDLLDGIDISILGGQKGNPHEV